MTMYKPALRT